MRLQILEGRKRGKGEYVRILGPAASIEDHRTKTKDFKRSRESSEYESVIVFEKVSEIRLAKPKAPASTPHKTK